MRGTARAALAAAALVALVLPHPGRAAEPSPGALKKEIERILERSSFGGASWGVAVRSLRTGKLLYERDALKNLRPASTLKLVTTAAALDAFGPEARLRTTLETAGRLDAYGRVLGDAYLVGRGDPNLSGRFTEGRATAAFEVMADALRVAGVRRIEGRLVGHEGLFEGDRRGDDWSWGDLVWAFGAEVSALSFNDNAADLIVAPGERVGDPVFVDPRVPSSYYTVASTATTAPSGTIRALALARDFGGNVIRLWGTYPLGEPATELNVAVEDPALYAATVFGEVLAAKGIRVTGPLATAATALPAGLRVLAAHDSPPMAEIVKAVNKTSQNLHAEMLLRLVGARASGRGSADLGRAAVRDFLRRLGVSQDGWALQDGSGLSRSDLLNARDLVGFLAAMDRHVHARAFRDSLAVAGVDGTLKNRMRGTAAEGRVLAKTGTLRHASGLAGYVTTKGGGRLAFAVLVNNYTGPPADVVSAIDRIAVVLASR
jgi:D-alanyl-D-alanine carboxypeptidase/D-alanyl-D-alanine-endopeptidase (penicillin-binding protein 4)